MKAIVKLFIDSLRFKAPLEFIILAYAIVGTVVMEVCLIIKICTLL